jgi:hypothetical protein
VQIRCRSSGSKMVQFHFSVGAANEEALGEELTI